MSLEELIADTPFSYRATASGQVHIAYRDRTVTTLSGREADRFLARVDATDGSGAQLLMAKATGNFKRGNERAAKRRRSEGPVRP
jgi:hypothetical protein